VKQATNLEKGKWGREVGERDWKNMEIIVK